MKSLKKEGGYIRTNNLKKKYQEPNDNTAWENFEDSDVGKFVDARGFSRMFGMDQGIGGTIGKYFGYDSDEGADLALDASAMVVPAADFANAANHYNKGEYLDAALYTGFAAVPFAAGPLVKGSQKWY